MEQPLSSLTLRRVDRADPAVVQAYAAHLLRLDTASRISRFGGGVSDLGLQAHAAHWRPLAAWSAIDASGMWRGVVEVHGNGTLSVELALSLEKPWRGVGWGRRLLDAACAWSASAGLREVTCVLASHNPSMRHLVQHAGGVRRPVGGLETWSLMRRPATAAPCPDMVVA
jgi:GNAT superfamily N-acetyltransferase